MAKVKLITPKEKKFARALFEGTGPVEAARSVLKWKCEVGSKEYQQARDLARSPRVKAEIEALKSQDQKQAAARSVVEFTQNKAVWSDIRSFAFDRLIEIRDSPEANSATRHKAILALEKLKDPASDISLIFRWIDIMWRYYNAHCPCCHADFPLWQVENPALEKYWEDNEIEPPAQIEDLLTRKLALLERARPARPPHQGQIPVIAAEERNVVALGAARTGKSTCLGMFGFMYIMIPGAEIWLLSQTYEMCINEFQYVESYLNTLFHPIGRHIINVNYDKKTDEGSIRTEWNGLLVTKSGHAKSSITGREIEAGLVAEPAWVDADLYEELRARMSSRLGRIIAMGTPKGFGGFLVRMVKQGGRSANTGKKIDPSDRLIKNGCPWGKSLAVLNLKPEDNPEYVVSELEAAKEELTEAEYRSEFGGEMFSAEGSKFPYIKPEHLVPITYDTVRKCHFVQGVDQGPVNFGSVTLGWDGHNIYVLNEFFDNSEKTIKANMLTINNENSGFLKRLGGSPENWKLTIFDADPPVQGILNEMKVEGHQWKTEVSFRPKNKNEQQNWRAETYEFINECARQGRLFFSSQNCDLLHEQFMDCLNKPEVQGKESTNQGKGWLNYHWRKDHVLDAAVLAFWTIYNSELPNPPDENRPYIGDGFEEEAKAQLLMRKLQEKRELSGFVDNSRNVSYNQSFKETFGRPAPGANSWDFLLGEEGYYSDES